MKSKPALAAPHLLFLAAVNSLLFSCGQPDHQPASAAKSSMNADSTTKTFVIDSAKAVPADSSRAGKSSDSQQAERVLPDTATVAATITDWKEFFRQLKTAIAKKDTHALSGLTHFPFYVNSYCAYRDEYGLSPDIKKITPESGCAFIGDQEFWGTDNKTNIRYHFKSDSVFIIGVEGAQICFGKVNGGYLLLSLLTPG